MIGYFLLGFIVVFGMGLYLLNDNFLSEFDFHDEDDCV